MPDILFERAAIFHNASAAEIKRRRAPFTRQIVEGGRVDAIFIYRRYR